MAWTSATMSWRELRRAGALVQPFDGVEDGVSAAGAAVRHFGLERRDGDGWSVDAVAAVRIVQTQAHRKTAGQRPVAPSAAYRRSHLVATLATSTDRCHVTDEVTPITPGDAGRQSLDRHGGAHAGIAERRDVSTLVRSLRVRWTLPRSLGVPAQARWWLVTAVRDRTHRRRAQRAQSGRLLSRYADGPLPHDVTDATTVWLRDVLVRVVSR